MHGGRDEISVHVRAMEEILKRDSYYEIPLYQRNYDWDFDDHVIEFWNDLKKEYESNLREKYFFGTLMLVNTYEEKDRFIIIDGQQRLTTSLILIIAFRDYFLEQGDTIKVDSLNKTLITEYTKLPRLTLNVYNKDYFLKKILEPKNINKKITALLDDPSIKTKNKKLQKAYVALAQKILDYKKGETTQKEELSNIIEHFLRYFTIVENLIDDLEKAYRIFENINSKGLDLAPSDLVKNYLFEKIALGSKSLSTQEREDLILEADEIWQSIVRILEMAKPITESIFLRMYLTAFVRLVSKEDIYKTIKVEYETKEQVDNFLRRLELRVSNLHKLVKPSLEDWNRDQEVVDCLQSLRKLGQGAMYPILLSGMEKFTKPNDIKKLIITSTKLFFRAKTVCSRNFSDLENLVDDICKVIRADKEVTISKIQKIMFDWNQYPPDEEFKVKFKTLELTDARAKYALSEIHYEMKGGRSGSTEILSDKAQIEHIMPQKIKNSPWENEIKQNKGYTNDTEVDEYKKINLNKLGNLTILNSVKNIKNSNKSFSEKKIIYGNSNEITMTRDLERQPQWTDDEIQTRQDGFIPLAVKIWNLKPTDNTD